KARRESFSAGVTSLTSASRTSSSRAAARRSASTGSVAITRIRMPAGYPSGTRAKRSGPLAGVSLAGPRREQEQQPRVAARAHLVALGRVEDGERAGAGGGALAVLNQFDLALHDDQLRALVDLMLLQRLARGQLDDDRAALPLGLQHGGLVRRDLHRAQVPALHAAILPTARRSRDCRPHGRFYRIGFP